MSDDQPSSSPRAFAQYEACERNPYSNLTEGAPFNRQFASLKPSRGTTHKQRELRYARQLLFWALMLQAVNFVVTVLTMQLDYRGQQIPLL